MLETALIALLALTVLTWLTQLIAKGDPFRVTRVILAVAAALVFQLHVLLEGPNPELWPLYLLGLLTLLGVAVQWFRGSRQRSEDGEGR